MKTLIDTTIKMSLFSSRISELTARVRDSSRFFSSFRQSPYFCIRDETSQESPEGIIRSHTLFDPTMGKTVFSREKKVPKEVINRHVGASQGWVATIDSKQLHLTDLYMPWVSSPRVVSLLPSLGFCGQLSSKTAVSLSTCDPVQDDNFFVAAKLGDYQLSVCRSSDSKWTHIESESLLPASTITYSKRDKAFYFTTSFGVYLGLLDLSNYELKYHPIRFRNMPNISGARRKMLSKCQLSKHLVESPSGELIFIMWYTECITEVEFDGNLEITRIKPKRIMVFREDEKSKDFCYTEDIGDLCIFLGENEAFCVSASMYQGLVPNSIYYSDGPGIGYYHLPSSKVCPFDYLGLTLGSYWLDPIA